MNGKDPKKEVRFTPKSKHPKFGKFVCFVIFHFFREPRSHKSCVFSWNQWKSLYFFKPRVFPLRFSWKSWNVPEKIEIIEKQNFSMFNSSKENASIFNKNTKSCKKHKKHSFSPSFTKAYTNQFTNEQYLLFFQFFCRFGLILKLGIPNCMSPFPFNSTKFYQKQ